jgi:hypothetical protein
MIPALRMPPSKGNNAPSHGMSMITRSPTLTRDVVTMVIKRMEKCFDKMTVTRGKEHVFLVGMNIPVTLTKTLLWLQMKDRPT